MLTRASVVIPAWYIRKENACVHDMSCHIQLFCVSVDQSLTASLFLPLCSESFGKEQASLKTAGCFHSCAAMSVVLTAALD